ncbi:MAG: adenosine deaminase [Saprospiraceae bacterium]
MAYQDLPKIELHLHLDCSLSYEAARMLEPGLTLDTFREEFIAPAKCADLVEYIDRATRSIGLMQTPEALRLVTLDLFRQLQEDNVIYAEIRFAPLEHTLRGMTPEAVVAAVDEAVATGIQQYGIQAGILLCTLRHYTEEQSLQTIKLVEQFHGTSHVVGFDIASDEAGYPIDNHIAAFAYAKAKNIPCTAHAGEALGAHSVWKTLQHFQPSRIGHGVRSVEDPRLIDHLRKHNIHLEVCPTSNVQTNVYSTIRQHVADQLYQAEVSMSINTDGRTLTNIDLFHEYNLLADQFGWEASHFLRCNLEAVAHAFAPESVKATLRQQLLEGWGIV